MQGDETMEDSGEKAYIFGTMFTLSNKLQMLGDRLDKRLTVKQWLLLAGILTCGNDAPTIGEVAALIGSSRQNVKKMALILEKEGFVCLLKDSGDGRLLRVSLTAFCMEHLKQREENERHFIETLFSGFEMQELLSFSRSLTRLQNNARGMGRDYEEKE